MDLILLCFLPCILWKMRYCKTGFREDYLSISGTKALRGIMAVFILFHHLSQRLQGLRLLFFFDHVAILCVAAFFFLSGYGLQKSYQEKPGYSGRILRSRIPAVAIPYLLLMGIYWLYSALSGNPYSIGEVLLSLINGFPIVDYSWYLLAILLMYVLFYISTRLFPPESKGLLFFHVAFALVWVPFCRSIGYEFYWYYSIIAFSAGIFWAMEEKKLLPPMQKHYFPLLIGSLLVFGGCLIAAIKTTVGIEVVVPFFWGTCCGFLAFLLLVLMKFSFGNRILLFLGELSFEIYGLQGLFIRLFRNETLWIQNDTLWCMAVILSTVAGAWLLHEACRRILPK